MSTLSLLLLLFSPSAFADLYFMIEKAKVFQCSRGGEMELSERDIRATDSQGREVHYFKAPGEVVITFRNIRVRQPLKNLAGDLSVNLQVPLGDSPLGFRWDIPYSAIPQKKLIGGYTCDGQSGYIQVGNRHVCRYCNLCMTTAIIEQKLSSNQQFLPNLGRNEDKFSRICNNVKPSVYQMTRTIHLPSKEELKRIVDEKYSKIENTLKSKLNLGKGKFQVYLKAVSASSPTENADRFYHSHKGCDCCASDSKNNFRCATFGCKNKCRNDYAQTCLAGKNPKVVACYTVEFNFKTSENYAEVQQFLRQNGFSEGGAPRRGGGAGGNYKQRCANAIADASSKRYCSINFNPAYCCKKCPGICPE